MYCGPLLYVFSHLCIKNSFLVFYLRLTADTHYRRTCVALIAINTSIFIACVVPGAFGCQPITFFWNKLNPSGKCINLNGLYLANAALNMAMDLCILGLPVPMIWNNRGLTMKRKIIASLLLLLGIFTCACSIIRIPNLNKALLDGNITWDAVDSHKWSNIEIHVATLTACIPTIKPLFQTLITGETIAERNARINQIRRASSAKTDSTGAVIVSELDGSNAGYVARKLSVAAQASGLTTPLPSPAVAHTPQRVETEDMGIQWTKDPFANHAAAVVDLVDDRRRDYHETLGPLPYGFDTRRRPSILAGDPFEEEDIGPMSMEAGRNEQNDERP